MNDAFTPGSTRVLDYAQRLAADEPSGSSCFGALLLGLLAEAECRAALMLAEKGVDIDVLWDHCPVFRQDQTFQKNKEGRPSLPARRAPSWHEALGDVVSAAEPLLIDFPRPVEIATEHLLYGLVAGDHELSTWLVEQGFVPETLREEILQLHGYGSGPLDCDELGVDVPPDELPNDSLDGSNAPAIAIAPSTTPGPIPATHRQPPYRPLVGDAGALRVLDAAANRAREALRVAEDYVRFVLDDRHLTERLKRLRHRLAEALAVIEGPERYACRETRDDVGTVLTTPSELSRADIDAVLTANFKRLGESLRSLEEFGKTIDAEFAAAVEQIRYEAYTLEAAVHRTRRSLDGLADARLYVLVDGSDSAAAFAARADELVRTGVGAIQLRDKRLADRELIALARQLCAATAETRTLAIVNDRPDVAAIVGADGVHVGQDEMSVHEARSIVGPRMLIGVSTHSIVDARRAVLDGANYIGVGPTFESPTKSFATYSGVAAFPGVGLVSEVANEIRLPAFAIGGITPQNAGEVLATGIHGVAVSGAIAGSSDPTAAVAAFQALLAER